MLSLSLVLTSGCGAALLAAAVSMRFGQLAGVLAAALGGCGLAIGRSAKPDDNLMRGAIGVYAVLLGGLILAGSIVAQVRRTPVGGAVSHSEN